MAASQIFLVIISGLGVIHGLFLAIFLWTTRKGNLLANRLLGTLLLVFSFRVGKSVFLEFLENLDVKFIFIGLGTMLSIGPLYFLYARASADQSFRWNQKYLLHFLPSLLGILFGCWIRDTHLDTLPLVFFFTLFCSYYVHYLVYLILTKRYISKQQKAGLPVHIHKLLNLLFYSLLIIWIAYVLNLFDESVPYVIGPVLYSVVAYIVSFVIISKGWVLEPNQEKYKTTRVSEEQMEQLFSKAKALIVDSEQFKDPNLTLKALSETLKVSTQVLSMVINQKSQKNFNAFVNYYRIEEAMKLLKNPDNTHQTISAIGFESGFNSISSFNSAFKKQTGSTPASYRQHLTE